MKCFQGEEIAGRPALPMHWLQPIKASEEFATAVPAQGERSESRPLFLQPWPPSPTQGRGWNLQSWTCAPAGTSPLAALRGCHAAPWPSGKRFPMSYRGQGEQPGVERR